MLRTAAQSSDTLPVEKVGEMWAVLVHLKRLVRTQKSSLGACQCATFRQAKSRRCGAQVVGTVCCVALGGIVKHR